MVQRSTTTRVTGRWAAALVVAAGVALGLGWQLSDAAATPPHDQSGEITPVTTSSAVGVAEAPSAEPEPQKDTARIVFTTMPAANATVTWGRKSLGRIRPGRPLVIERPRDSGPLDVMVRAPGYLPVQTRAHTFADTRLLIKLTRPEDKHTLLGYREPLDAGVPGLGDGGVPPDLSGMPPSLSESSPASQPQQSPAPSPVFETGIPAFGP